MGWGKEKPGLVFWKTLLLAASLHTAVFAGVALERALVGPPRAPESIIYLESTGVVPAVKRAPVRNVPPPTPATPLEVEDEAVESELHKAVADEGNSDAPTAAEQGSATSPAGGSGEWTALAAYKTRVREAIESERRYPHTARSLGEAGVVHVAFRVERDGAITSIELKVPCAFQSLNQEAVATLARVARVDAIPDDLERDVLDLIIPIEFRLD